MDIETFSFVGTMWARTVPSFLLWLLSGLAWSLWMLGAGFDGWGVVDADRLWRVEEVAVLLGVSARWLAGQCRAQRVEHVHVARQRRFTKAQLEALITRFTVRPAADLQADATKARVVRMLARKAVQR